MSTRARFWTIVAAIALALLLLSFYEEPLLVEARPVVAENLVVSIRDEGRTRLRHHYDVVAPITGRMGRVELHVGDPLVAGDLITRIRPAAAPLLDARSRAEARSAVATAEAGVAAAQAHEAAVEAEGELAKSELARGEPVFAEGRLSALDIERLRSAVRQAEAHVRQATFETGAARARLAAAEATLARYDAPNGDDEPIAVTAPITGFVTALGRESAGPIAQGERIVQLGRLDDLEVEVDVLSADAVRIQPGGAVRLHRWGGAAPLDAVVQRVEPVGFMKVSALGVEEQRVLVICDLLTDSETRERLGAGYRVDAEFILWKGQDVLQLDASSLFRRGDDWAVFVVEDGRARMRAVEIGQSAGLRVQVLAGLDVGELVITHPDERLEDGTRVSLAPSVEVR